MSKACDVVDEGELPLLRENETMRGWIIRLGGLLLREVGEWGASEEGRVLFMELADWCVQNDQRSFALKLYSRVNVPCRYNEKLQPLDIRAATQLGELYEDGIDGDKSDSLALHHYERAANGNRLQEIPDSQNQPLLRMLAIKRRREREYWNSCDLGLVLPDILRTAGGMPREVVSIVFGYAEEIVLCSALCTRGTPYPCEACDKMLQYRPPRPVSPPACHKNDRKDNPIHDIYFATYADVPSFALDVGKTPDSIDFIISEDARVIVPDRNTLYSPDRSYEDGSGPALNSIGLRFGRSKALQKQPTQPSFSLGDWPMLTQ
jgi:hypothetical protein